MKNILAVITLCCLFSIGTKAQNYNVCPDSTNYTCTLQPSVTFLAITNNPITVCAGQAVNVCATYTNVPGRSVATITHAPDCAITTETNSVSATVVSNWWVATIGAFTASNTNLCATFSPTNEGSGTIKFYLAYTNSSPCPTQLKIVTNTVPISVGSAPSLTSQPTNQTTLQGSNATFAATATGTVPLSFQWFFNTTNLLVGKTNASLILTNVDLSQAGNYAVRVTNICGSIFSSNAGLTVTAVTAPSITNGPASHTVAQGSNATFTVTATGTSPLNYQWRFNGINISGATSSSYTVTDAQHSNSGSYSATVSNSGGSVTSANGMLTVVSINRVTVDGLFPEIQGATSVCTNTTVTLRAMLDPANASFPSTTPVWSVVSQPSGASLTAPSPGSVTASFTPAMAGQYVIGAACGTSSKSFVITVVDVSDANYNGISDCAELAYGTNGIQTQLGSWRFDTPDWIGLQGQSPLIYTNLQLKAGFSIGALEINSNAGPARLVYSDMNTNTSIANINYREGSVRFWFRPNWSSGTGAGPKQPEARLIEAGTKGTTGGSWGLYLNSTGTALSFCTQTNSISTLTTNIVAAISWTSNSWHHITLTYSLTNSTLYLDGQQTTNGWGVTNWPGLSVRANGFRIGTDINGTNWAQGRFDNFETFNYVLPGSYATNYFISHSTAPAIGTNSCALAPMALYFPLAQTLTNFQLFYVTNGHTSGNIGWLDWNGTYNGNGLVSLLNNFNLVSNFVDAVDSTLILKFGSWIHGSSGASVGQVKTPLDNLISNQTVFGVVLWDGAAQDSGSNFKFQAAGYINVRLVDYDPTGISWIKCEYRGVRLCDEYYPNQLPTCQIVSPTNDQPFTAWNTNLPATIPITVAASDLEDGLVSVACYSSTNANFLGKLFYYQATTNANTNLFTYIWTNAPHGTNYLTAISTDELGGSATSQVVRAVVNWPPSVSAGQNQTIIWSQGTGSTNVSLNGNVSDDGLPFGTLTTTWSVVSSNGPVTFGNVNATNTTATFLTNGTYVLALTASDGAASASSQSTITITVSAPLISVSLTNPVNGQLFVISPTNILLSATASSSQAGISKIEFYSGATKLGEATNSPYNFLWENVTNGVYNLTAKATDSLGANGTSANINITVNAMPSVNIVTPTNNTAFTEVANVTISATASDTDGTISQVSFYHGTNLIGTVTSPASGLYTLAWNGLTNRVYPITAVATDNRGATAVSTIRMVKVNSTNLQPSVAITFPTNDMVFRSGSDITITATASDPDGYVTRVDFFVDGTYLGTDTTTPYNLKECCWREGSYKLVANATDNQGSTMMSAPIMITVSPTVPSASDGFWDQEFGNPGGTTYDSRRSEGITSMVLDGRDLYVVGDFKDINGSSSSSSWLEPIAKWDGTNWMGMPDTGSYPFWGVPSAIAVQNTNIYAAGRYYDSATSITYGILKRWNGTSWELAADLLDAPIYTMAVIDNDVYVGGAFREAYTTAGTDTNIWAIAKLQGTNWTPVGSPLNSSVLAIAVIKDKIYVGGFFTNASGNSNANYIAQLNGNSWTNLGTGIGFTNNIIGNSVTALAVRGDDLIVGGSFPIAGDITNANNIAIWNQKRWEPLGGGLSANLSPWTWNFRVMPFFTWAGVKSIVVKCNDIFVGGAFDKALNGTNEIAVANIAKATWNEESQTWTWKDLDTGLITSDGFSWTNSLLAFPVYSLVLIPGGEPGAYDLIAGGEFTHAGRDLTFSSAIARWSVGRPFPTAAPTVSITTPSSGTIFTNPSSILIQAQANSNYTNLTAVEFFADGVSLGNVTSAPYEITWSSGISLTTHFLTATVADAAGRKGRSSPAIIKVLDTNNPVIAHDDTYLVLADSRPTNLDVLTNDLPSGLLINDVWVSLGNPFQHIGKYGIGQNNKYLTYSPAPNSYGTEVFGYTVTNNAGASDSAAVTIKLRSKPTLRITSPDGIERFGFSNSVTVEIAGYASDYDGTVTNIAISLDGTFWNQTNNDSFAFPWTIITPGFYTFAFVAKDNDGLSNKVWVLVNVYDINSTNIVTATIDNLSGTPSSLVGNIPPVIREGFFDLEGKARDSNTTNPVSYQLQLLRPEDNSDLDSEAVIFANVTPGALDTAGFHQGGDTNGALGRLNFSGMPNGIYDLKLIVHGGGVEATTTVRFQLDSQLKIGQFSFSEQDLAIPVAGIPITVTRTYNSMNQRNGPFGQSWTYSLNDMDVQLDELREDVQTGGSTFNFADIDEDENGLPQPVNIRVGGSRDVTLTLPDGRRTTFAFVPRKAPFNYYAEWKAAPGITATLTPIGSEIIDFWPAPAHWHGGGENSTFENYDVPGWILETQDGTKFNITRGAGNQAVYENPDNPYGFPLQTRAYGPPKLTSIEQRTGDKILISPKNIQHKDSNNVVTRTIYFDRDSSDRITEIRDPNSGSNGLPTMRYVYNRDTGNLIQVHRLVNRETSTYTTNKYHYDHPSFPHYITSIEDPRGVPIAKNFYDDSGKLIAVEDADGKRTEFIHNTTNKVEIVVDRLGNTNSYVYDLRGNVTGTTNALGQITKMGYDDNNNKTNDIVFLGGVAYATNQYEYTPNNLLTKTFDTLGNSNTFTYTGVQVETSTDAKGFTSTNYYNPVTGNLTGTSDAQGNLSTNFFNDRSLLTGSRDAVGTFSTNYYDGVGNLTATATLASNGSTILSTNSFGYDVNGNRTNQIVWRQVSGTWRGATNAYIYDGQNRVVHTIDPDGLTNSVIYNSIGKQEATIDKLGRTNRYEYDFQGRLFRTTYPDESLTLSEYDSEGRRTNSVDRAGRSTVSQYDALGRLTNTIYADLTHSATVYDDLGRVKWSIDARGITNAPGYDVLGRRVSMTNALGASEQMVNRFGYDANGNQPYVTNALGVVTTNVFDALNRVVQMRFADGTSVFTGYDAVGRRVAETNQDNIVTRFGYDGVGRLLVVTNAFGKAEQTLTLYEYDEAGNQLRQIDALNRTNQYAYDDMGRRISHTMPDTSLVERFSYTALGNVRYHTNFNSVVITNQYDVLNRLTNRISGLYQVQYTYTVSGQRETMTDASGVTTYIYDNRDRLKTNATPQGTIFYTYDDNGNQTGIKSSNPNGSELIYQYDSLNRLTNVLDAKLGLAVTNTSYRYDAVGNLQGYNYPNGVTNHHQYDLLNRLTNLVWKQSGSARWSFFYQLGLTGNRTNLSETVNSVSRGYFWEYDSLYRLTNETVSGTSPTGNLGYGYDSVGNRLSRTGTLGSLGSQSLSYNTNDWLTSETNDNNGSTTVSGENIYQYDIENRLTNANSGAILIVYNGDGVRVSKMVSGATTHYLVADQNPTGYGQVLEEFTVSGGTTNVSRRYGIGNALISQTRWNGSSWVSHFYGYDGHGSVRFLTDTSGAITDTYIYDAYGVLINSTGSTPNNIRYAGEQYDPDLDASINRARLLNLNIGRFWTMDLFEGHQNSPMSLHKYLYCLANPIDGIDPTGLETMIVVHDDGRPDANRSSDKAARHFSAAGWTIRTMTLNNFAQITGKETNAHFEGLILGGHGDETLSGGVSRQMLENILNNNHDKMHVLIALSCHSIDFASPLTPKYTTSDALIVTYRGYNWNSPVQNYKIGRTIDKWIKNPTYTFEHFGVLVADGLGITGRTIYDIMSTPMSVNQMIPLGF